MRTPRFARLVSEFALTEAKLAEMIPSGRAKTFANRVAWAMTHTYQAGLLERPRDARQSAARSSGASEPAVSSPVASQVAADTA